MDGYRLNLNGAMEYRNENCMPHEPLLQFYRFRKTECASERWMPASKQSRHGIKVVEANDSAGSLSLFHSKRHPITHFNPQEPTCQSDDPNPSRLLEGEEGALAQTQPPDQRAFRNQRTKGATNRFPRARTMLIPLKKMALRLPQHRNQ